MVISFLIQLITLILFCVAIYISFFYLPNLTYGNRVLSLLSMNMGLIVILHYTGILVSLSSFLEGIDKNAGIFGILIFGLIVESLVFWYIYSSKLNVAIHDCRFFRFISGFISDIKYREIGKKIVNENQKVIAEPHSGVIIALRGKSESIYCEGFELLKQYFEENNILFNFYVCRTPEDAKTVIENDKVEKIWIFGHGYIGGLDFGENGVLKYGDLKNAPKKDFIGQFHCNTEAKICNSLADFILKPNGKKFVHEGFRCVRMNREAIECCIKRNWDCDNACDR